MAPKQKYPAELRERAVRLVREAQQNAETSYGAPSRIAHQLGINADTLRGWLKQTDIDEGIRPGIPTPESARIQAVSYTHLATQKALPFRDIHGGVFAAFWPVNDAPIVVNFPEQ